MCGVRGAADEAAAGVVGYQIAVKGWHRLNVHGRRIDYPKARKPLRGGFKTRPYHWIYTLKPAATENSLWSATQPQSANFPVG